jgi:hypothetical protein
LFLFGHADHLLDQLQAFPFVQLLFFHVGSLRRIRAR